MTKYITVQQPSVTGHQIILQCLTCWQHCHRMYKRTKKRRLCPKQQWSSAELDHVLCCLSGPFGKQQQKLLSVYNMELSHSNSFECAVLTGQMSLSKRTCFYSLIFVLGSSSAFVLFCLLFYFTYFGHAVSHSIKQNSAKMNPKLFVCCVFCWSTLLTYWRNISIQVLSRSPDYAWHKVWLFTMCLCVKCSWN